MSRPKAFIPNGCTASPDGMGGVRWKGCCDRHDLAFHVGGWNVFRKWRADFGLGWCMAKRFWRGAREPIAWHRLRHETADDHDARVLLESGRRIARGVGALFVPLGYVAVTATIGLGWWNWRGNPMPTHEELQAIEGYTHEQVAALANLTTKGIA